MSALGCSPLRRASECKQVVELVNDGLGSMATSMADAGPDPAKYARVADAYEALGKSLEAASSRDETLSKTIESYRELIQRAAKHSREFSEELERPASTPEEEHEKETRLARLRAVAKNDVNREASLVRKLNGLCHTQ